MKGHFAFGACLASVIVLSGFSVALAIPDGPAPRLVSWVKFSNGLPVTGKYLNAAFGDMNKDGKLDVITSGESDGLRVYIGDGAGNWTPVSNHPATSGNFAEACVLDFEGDTNPDIFAASPGTTGPTQGLHLYKGNGAGGFTDVTSSSGLPTASIWRGCAAGDVNNDGKLDVASSSGYGGGNQGAHVFTGDGKGKFTDNSSGLPVSQDKGGANKFADFNGDGDLDIVSGGETTITVHLGNGGRGGAMQWTNSSTGLPGSKFRSFDVGDVDKDGMIDIIGSVYGSGQGIRAFRNVNNASSWSLISSSGLPSNGNYIDVGIVDFDNNGTLDVFSNSVGGGSHVWYGSGTGTWKEDSTGLPTNGRSMGSDVGDFNNDGSLDLVISHYDSGLEGVSAWKNIGSAPIPPSIVSTNPVDGATGVPINVNIRITFSVPMDKLSVQTALNVTPNFQYIINWDGASKVVTMTPSPPLQLGTKYTINVSASAKSQAGINLPNQYSFSFTTDTGGGPTPPTVTSVEPANHSTNITAKILINITFSKPMEKGTTEGAITASPSVTWGASWSNSDQTVTLDPTADLTFNTKYTVTISTAAKSVDQANLRFPYFFDFTTESGGMPTPPTVTATNPQNGSTNVPLNTNIEITFSEKMDGTATENAVSTSPSVSGSFQWDASVNVLTYDPSVDLQANTKFTITISAQAKDATGENMQGSYQFSFTTGSTSDTTPPTVASTNPLDNSVNIDYRAPITVTFSEPMDTSSTGPAISISPGSIKGRSWDAAGKVVTISPVLVNGTTYSCTVSNGAKDLVGNHMVNAYTFKFTTKQAAGDTTPPTVLGTSPSNASKDIDPTDLKVKVTFSEPMDAASVEVALSIEPGVANFSANWSADDTVITLTGNFDGAKTYTTTISSAAKDKAGNKMTLQYSFSFTTKGGGYTPGPGTGPNWVDLTFLLPLLIIVIAVIATVAVVIALRKRKRAVEVPPQPPQLTFQKMEAQPAATQEPSTSDQKPPPPDS